MSDTNKLPSYGESLYTMFKAYEGAEQWGGIVETIQKWTYGKMVRAAWCSTSISYFLTKLGFTIKYENVNELRSACYRKSNVGTGTYYKKGNFPKTLKRGDILFYLWEGYEMRNTSKKHVSVCAANTDFAASSVIPSIGGNQSGSICIKNYDKKYLYAVYRV